MMTTNDVPLVKFLGMELVPVLDMENGKESSIDRVVEYPPLTINGRIVYALPGGAWICV